MMTQISQGSQIGEKLLKLDLMGLPSTIKGLQKLHNGRYHLCDGTQDMINVLAKKGEPLLIKSHARVIEFADIIAVSMTDLGYPGGGTFEDGCNAGVGLGLHICPGFFGLLIRDAYVHREGWDFYRIAMKPITQDGYANHFMLERDTTPDSTTGKSLSHSFGFSELMGYERLIFWRPSKTS